MNNQRRDIEHKEGTFQGVNDLELFYQYWRPVAEPRAVVALVHGVTEHCGRYLNVVDLLTTGCYLVYAFDQRGHGRSPGQRVHIDHWREYRGDLKAFLELIGKQAPGKPIFLYGHSMGALVVLDYLVHDSSGLKGAIISGAPIEPEGVGNPFLIALARALSGIWPRFSLDPGLDPTAISRDPQAVEAYLTDPLCTHKVTVRWGTESLEAVARVKERAAEIDLPILLIHGEDDRLNLAEGSRFLYEQIAHPDKTLQVYPGGYHDLHNDLDHEKVLADVKSWLDQHL